MKIIRYQTKSLSPRFGWVYQDMVGEIEGSPYSDYRRFDLSLSLDEITLLPPCQPSKIICVGRNFVEHARENDVELPNMPLLFLKPPSALITTGQPIVLPPQSTNVEHEAELAIVIGKAGRWIQPENVNEHILGYTIANDVTARDLQRRDNQWTRGKGFDTFCPLGPWIETEFDPSDALITCHVNGSLRQMASTRDMVFTIQQIISFASSVMTLIPGDVILTGTPAGVGPLVAGNQVVIHIDGIGNLSNPVIAETTPSPIR